MKGRIIMKALNSIKFVVKAEAAFNKWLNAIDSASSYEEAKKSANAAFGFVDCMTTYLNCMIAAENNEFTANLDELLTEWEATIYQRMICKAMQTKQPYDVIQSLEEKREQIEG